MKLYVCYSLQFTEPTADDGQLEIITPDMTLRIKKDY